GTERIHEIDVASIEEARLIPHIEALINARQWALAKEQLERLARISGYQERSATAYTFARLLDFFCLVDRLAYGYARDALRQLRQRRETRAVCATISGLEPLLAA